ncbi:MAG: hypothetical protein EB119_09490 [Synechococcaceae bacterium WBB_34_004]|nr:hypothetical protein [Synechococcaceae bacterium WBB_34_004]
MLQCHQKFLVQLSAIHKQLQRMRMVYYQQNLHLHLNHHRQNLQKTPLYMARMTNLRRHQML